MKPIIIAIILATLNRQHECRWALCPYKGIKYQCYREAVLEYIDPKYDSTDAYYIDILHLKYPSLDTDELHDKLYEQTDH